MRDTFELDLDLNIGNDWIDEWLWEIDGVPVDLTGATAVMHLRRTTDAPLLLEVSTANGRLALGGVNGTITFSVGATTMAALSGVGVFQLDIVFSNGRDWRHSDGSFKTYKDAVR